MRKLRGEGLEGGIVGVTEATPDGGDPPADASFVDALGSFVISLEALSPEATGQDLFDHTPTTNEELKTVKVGAHPGRGY